MFLWLSFLLASLGHRFSLILKPPQKKKKEFWSQIFPSFDPIPPYLPRTFLLLVSYAFCLITNKAWYSANQWIKHGKWCQRNTILIFYYLFKVVLRMLSQYDDQKNSGILHFLNYSMLKIVSFRKYFPYRPVHCFTMQNNRFLIESASDLNWLRSSASVSWDLVIT